MLLFFDTVLLTVSILWIESKIAALKLFLSGFFNQSDLTTVQNGSKNVLLSHLACVICFQTFLKTKSNVLSGML